MNTCSWGFIQNMSSFTTQYPSAGQSIIILTLHLKLSFTFLSQALVSVFSYDRFLLPDLALEHYK